MEGWDVYRELFDEILMDAEDGGHKVSEGSTPKFYLLPQWTFDILHEFVYQFQGFCQVRTTLHANAVKHGVLGEPTPEGEPTINASAKATHHVIENVTVLAQQGTEAWAVESVLDYLQRLVAIGTSKECNVPAYQYMGLFASVTLSRLECLVSDYTASLQALAPIYESNILVCKADQETKTALEVVHTVFAARLSLNYHAAISFLMLRRYKDAVTILGEICAYMHRGFKVGETGEKEGQLSKGIFIRLVLIHCK
jgi:translation initiation factor 3 subunit L